MRVKSTCDDGIAQQDRDPLWLLIEWPDSDPPRPTKSSLTTLPAKMGEKEIIRLLDERWRTERVGSLAALSATNLQRVHVAPDV